MIWRRRKKRQGRELIQLVLDAIRQVHVQCAEPDKLVVSSKVPRGRVTTMRIGGRFVLYVHERDWSKIELAAKDYDTELPITTLWGLPVNYPRRG